jgi:hypothetical protein
MAHIRCAIPHLASGPPGEYSHAPRIDCRLQATWPDFRAYSGPLSTLTSRLPSWALPGDDASTWQERVGEALSKYLDRLPDQRQRDPASCIQRPEPRSHPLLPPTGSAA